MGAVWRHFVFFFCFVTFEELAPSRIHRYTCIFRMHLFLIRLTRTGWKILPVRYVQWMKIAPRNEVSKESLSFTTCCSIANGNSGTAIIETEKQMTVKTDF